MRLAESKPVSPTGEDEHLYLSEAEMALDKTQKINGGC